MKSKRGSSETLRNESCFDFSWLAGLLDADGGIYVSRSRYVSFEITMHQEEEQTLQYIKKFLGGSITPRKGKKAVRWRLHRREPVEQFLQAINGVFQTERIATQFEKACCAYDILPLPRKPLSLETAWLSGFFCGDGGFSINTASKYQPSLSISQRENAVLSRIEALVGGGVYYDKSWDGWLWWIDARSGPHIFDYFQRFSIRNPVKQARMKSKIRLMGYLERGLHKDPGSQARLHHFVRVFYKKEKSQD